MLYGSVCSGIEAASVAWHPLGWEAAWLSEIEPFPSAVLAHHYPTVPNRGDMTRFQEWPDDAIDLLVGGTPCQSFSVAGLRAGLADPRGNLLLTYLAIAARYRPRWLVWENVPGVLSSGDGRDFGSLLGGLAELGYGFAYRVLDAQFCRAHGFERAVPQRRRRVFVVGYLGDWRRAAAVLFDGASLRGDSAPRRAAGERVAPTISARPTGGGGLGTDFDLDGGVIAFGSKEYAQDAGEVSPPLRAMGHNQSHQNGGGQVAIAFAQNSRDEVRLFDGDGASVGALAAEPGMKQQTFIAQPVVLMERGRDGRPSLEYRQDGTANAILTPNGGRGGLGVGAIAFNPQAGGKQTSLGFDPGAQTTGTLEVNQTPAIAWSIMPQNSGKDFKARSVEVAQPIMAAGPAGGNQGGDYIQEAWAVRRLTPTECERLQGFPDGWTQVPHRGKPAADGPRYKALGNSMAVNVMRVLGTRIAKVEAT